MSVQVKLQQMWTLGKEIGRGGFGVVHEAESEASVVAAVKLVKKVPGTEREMLFTELPGVRNVVPIIDSGETSTHWVLVMPLAMPSLRQYLKEAAGPLSLSESITILTDIAIALSDLESKARAVHRDLKPENVLQLDGTWCLADFGAARYAEAATASLTQKGVLTPAYAAPERWRYERAGIATDVYALGVIAHELLSGAPPFPGPRDEDFRDQHMSATPPHLSSVPAAVAALIEACLFKAPEARPMPSEVVSRLAKAAQPASGGLAALQEANRAEAIRYGERERRKSEEQLEAERRARLFDAAKTSLDRISNELLETLTDAAPTAQVKHGPQGSWRLRLNDAELFLFVPSPTKPSPWGNFATPAFDVLADTVIGITIPPNQYGYGGRRHSLWYCDAHTADRYHWFETAFMVTPGINRNSDVEPFDFEPGEKATKALSTAITEWQVAWPFTLLVPGDLGTFISNWAGWFAAGATNNLVRPSSMPEQRPEGTWRRS